MTSGCRSWHDEARLSPGLAAVPEPTRSSWILTPLGVLMNLFSSECAAGSSGVVPVKDHTSAGLPLCWSLLAAPGR